MARRALLVGIDKYDVFSDLSKCVKDATDMQAFLKRNADGSPNYSCHLMVYGGKHRTPKITRARLRAACNQLFDYTGDVLLFFSGHGALTKTGGYLGASDSRTNDWGIPMEEIIDMANISPARDILFILDCCHAGAAGNTATSRRNGGNPIAQLRENMTIIAASRETEYAFEDVENSLFTASVLQALDGGAADHMGWITAQSIYAFVERGFGSWGQRPVYKSHATDLTIIRQAAPLIERLKLHQLVTYFPTENYKFALDPEYDPEDENGKIRGRVNQKKLAAAKLFKDCRDAGLLKSTSGEQFYWVARKRGTLELTLRGREYWRLVKNDLI